MSLLPSLTRTWMPRGEQLKVKAPGTNEKRSVSAAIDIAQGTPLWRTGEKRNSNQFCATLGECAERSTARGRVAVLLTDNAPTHKAGKTGIVRGALDELAGRAVVAFLPKYSPDLQPAERLWRQWRPNVTHNHTRGNRPTYKETATPGSAEWQPILEQYSGRSVIRSLSNQSFG